MVSDKNIWILGSVVILLSIIKLSFANVDATITKNLGQCCTAGKTIALTKSNCNSDDYNFINIPPIWNGLCHTTFGLCCSRALDTQQCIEGRKAAKAGTNCNGNGDNKELSVTYTDCCKACQIGLAVAANRNNCTTAMTHFAKDESFSICCTETQNNPNDDVDDEDAVSDDNDEIMEEVILGEGDTLCSKVENLCQHICKDTNESYKCLCRDGYRLNDNGVTCSLIESDINDDDEELEDDEDLNEGDDGISHCRAGYRRSDITSKCEDIDECKSGVAYCNIEQHCLNQPGTFQCLDIKSTNCPNGFRFNAKTEECEDINECLEEVDNCAKNGQTCLNNRGSYKCLDKPFTQCLGGFVYDPESRKCEDYDECVGSPCQNGFDCRNLFGGYECLPSKDKSSLFDLCGPGFRKKNNKCIDIDECLQDKDACGQNQVCTNEQGSYRCDCKIGFKLDGTLNACVDINECQINNFNCLSTHRCDNTIGSYTCIRSRSCGTGYTLNAETGSCDDDDECELGTHDCPQGYDCRNTIGSFRCDRKRFTTTTTTKRPISTKLTTKRPISTKPTTISTTISTTPTTATTPQQTPVYISPQHEQRPLYVSRQTHNQLSSDYIPTSTHRFRPPNIHNDTCLRGFHRNHMGACVDIDECRLPNTCGTHQRCINSNGSYRCQNLLQCSGGFKSTPDGSSCTDINECETGEHNCGPDQTCRNRIGGFICSCPIGHVVGNGNRCIDINECEHQICPSNSNCINTMGSYHCECKPGFKKNKENEKSCADINECTDIKGLCEQNCVNFWGSYRCTCNRGYELSRNNRTCNDIDECEVHKSYKLCMGFCVNVPGSYKCSCPSGYELAADKNTCRDIDECQQEVCNGRHEICTNIRGSYRCTTITCPYGYANDADQKNRCRLINNACEGDECHQKVTTYTYNFITLVSNYQIQPSGRVLFNLRGLQWYDSIDFDLNLTRVQAPPNVKKATSEYFTIPKLHNQVQLTLMRELEGPQDIELELSMTYLMNGEPRGKSVAKLFIIVSQYSF